ncbi:MAG: Gfo/Idh/MocA family oxidoreductase [bacterium]|jgi:predicted dehydrogenase
MKLKVAVIGMGGRGLFFCDIFNTNPRSEVVAVCDLDMKRLDAVRECLGAKTAYYQDSLQMLSEMDIDAVVVATNDTDHKEPVLQVLQAGRHCLVEKPMAQSLEDCDAMIAAAEKAGKILGVGLELRYCTLFQQMKEIIDRGDIGEIKLGWVVDNVSVGYTFFQRCFKHRSFAKSLLLQKGTHSIDLMNWFAGGNPIRVYGTGGLDFFGGKESPEKTCLDCEARKTCPYAPAALERKGHCGVILPNPVSCVFTSDVDVHDNAMLNVQYDNGVRTTYTECHFTPEYSREFTFVGDKGKIYGYYENTNFKIRVSRRHKGVVEEYTPPFIGGSHGGGDKGMIETFIDACLNGSEFIMDGLAGRNSVAVGLAGDESIRTGQPVNICKSMGSGVYI